jgi:hypothetical protein
MGGGRTQLVALTGGWEQKVVQGATVRGICLKCNGLYHQPTVR